MRHLNVALFGLVVTFSLTGCRRNTYKEVDYQTFHEKAVEANLLESGYTTATVNGTIDGSALATTEGGFSGSYTLKDVKITNLENGHVYLNDLDPLSMITMSREKLIAYAILSLEAHTFPEPTPQEDVGEYDVKFYAGSSGFKITAKTEKTEGTLIYNKYGLVSSLKASGEAKGKLTVKWSKK